MRKLVPAVLLGSSLLLCAISSSGQDYSVRVLATFDFPGSDFTTAIGINGRGDISGQYNTRRGETRGFVRYRDGSFSPPIIAPNDSGHVTSADDINDSQVIGGSFYSGHDDGYHGFILAATSFTEFNVDPSFFTLIRGINNAGDFVGYVYNSTLVSQAFVTVGGNTTLVSIPDATNSLGSDINSLGEVIGHYSTDGVTFHGFLRDPDGTLTFPIDFPGATSTFLEGINDRGWISGRYIDSGGVVHGMLLLRPDTFVTFDYPGALQTSLNGINNLGFIAGRYLDSSNLRHSFLARVR